MLYRGGENAGADPTHFRTFIALLKHPCPTLNDPEAISDDKPLHTITQHKTIPCNAEDGAGIHGQKRMNGCAVALKLT